MEAQYPPVTIVDADNQVIGSENFWVARDKGHFIRGSRIHVFNERNEILVQTRSEHVLAPGLLDCSAGGAVDYDESYEETAVRELHEELGIAGTSLTQMNEAWLHHRAFIMDFRVVINSSIEINYNQQEVAAVEWMSLEKLQLIQTDSPEKLASGLAASLERNMLSFE